VCRKFFGFAKYPNKISKLITNFNIQTSVTEDIDTFEEKATDNFMLRLPKLRVLFYSRGETFIEAM
jgi:hypothetical protein